MTEEKVFDPKFEALGVVLNLMAMARSADRPSVSIAAGVLAQDVVRLSADPESVGLRRQVGVGAEVLRRVLRNARGSG